MIADDEHKEVLLVVSGSKDTSDWLTDLRCASVTLPHAVGEPGEVVETHAGIWAAAVKLEERCLSAIQSALDEVRGCLPAFVCSCARLRCSGALVGGCR